jgi:hypothetical protein
VPGFTDMNNDELLKDLHTRFARVERAILGDVTVGHRGLVDRVDSLESSDKQATDAHMDIDRRRETGDKRIHKRIDEVEESFTSHATSIERKLDRVIWVAVGAFAGGLGTGGGVVWALLGG